MRARFFRHCPLKTNGMDSCLLNRRRCARRERIADPSKQGKEFDMNRQSNGRTRASSSGVALPSALPLDGGAPHDFVFSGRRRQAPIIAART
jgi:hypothetical protein